MSMNYNMLYTVIIVFGTVYVSTAIFRFFDIGVETYGIYLMFMISLACLYALLPQKVGSIF
jgi:hypothetical protein